MYINQLGNKSLGKDKGKRYQWACYGLEDAWNVLKA